MVPFHNLAQPTIFTNWCVSKYFSFPLPHQHFPNNQRIATLPAFSIGTIQATTRIIDGSFEISCQVLWENSGFSKVFFHQGRDHLWIFGDFFDEFCGPWRVGFIPFWTTKRPDNWGREWRNDYIKPLSIENDAAAAWWICETIFEKHGDLQMISKQSRRNWDSCHGFVGSIQDAQHGRPIIKSLKDYLCAKNPFPTTQVLEIHLKNKTVCNRNPSLCKW